MARMGIIDYNPQNSILTTLGELIALFNAKVDGHTEITSVQARQGLRAKGPKLKHTTPVDDALAKAMNAICNDREFEGLRKKEGKFIKQWRELEEILTNWDSLEVTPKVD